MSDYRFEIVKRREAHTGNVIDCLHVTLTNNSLVDIGDTYIPLDDIQTAIQGNIQRNEDVKVLHDALNEVVASFITDDELIEQLADKEHASWAHWMAYLFTVCKKQPDGSCVIHPSLVEHWQRQIDTPYAQLSEREKQSDRNQVIRILPIIKEYAHATPITTTNTTKESPGRADSREEVLYPSVIQQLCREAHTQLAQTYGDGMSTWNDLSEREQTLVESITVKVVHRLQRQGMLPKHVNEKEYDATTTATTETETGSTG